MNIPCRICSIISEPNDDTHCPFPSFIFHTGLTTKFIGLASRSVNIKFKTLILWQFSIKCKNEKNHPLNKHLNFHNQFTKYFLSLKLNECQSAQLVDTCVFFSTQPVCIVVMFQQLWGCYYFRTNSTYLYINSVVFFQFMFELSLFDFM